MKNKKLMSLGASAAAILAMAPVAANLPLIDNNVQPTIVKADSDAATTAQYLLNQYTSRLTLKTNDIANIHSTDVGAEYVSDLIDYNGVARSDLGRLFQNGKTFDKSAVQQLASYQVQVSFSGATSGKEAIIPAYQVASRLADLKINGGYLSETINVLDANGQVIAKTILRLTAQVPTPSYVTAFNMLMSTNLQAEAGKSADYYKTVQSLTDNGTIVDQNGNKIAGFNDPQTKEHIDFGSLLTDDGSTYTKDKLEAGHYHQTVLIYLNDSLAQSVQYADINGQRVSIHRTAGQSPYIEFNRNINVTPAASQENAETVNGTVTVKPTITSAHLYNAKGEMIADRALPGNSDWHTDRKLTLADGRILYRVSTAEYILSSQVNYSPKVTPNESTSSTSIKGNVVITQFSQHKILHVETPKLSNTFLWRKASDNQSMSIIADRALPGQSSWQTDQKAVIGENTFYRVSTNEWINASYVSIN
ncbi:hypothetical protein DS831_01355 [Bombilactobacillus bombi]|uniref:Surface layer protein A domain-containing protein n=1 Tax=Bombilactobacillus bombi TaxID=1303590 RepID=A0A417ZJ59_9LACO|nr:hypothetical protein [Bombilactobacillus bombi]RHW52005.1 hypothetical protein DS831_01355 [Bombilactobacillus bombi]